MVNGTHAHVCMYMCGGRRVSGSGTSLWKKYLRRALQDVKSLDSE